MLRHEKNFICTFPACKRGKKGFGTKNDLDRHRKAIHHLDLGPGGLKSYKCAAQHCEKPEKIWPRFDNFKQHVIRLHKDEHQDDRVTIEDIIKRYVTLLWYSHSATDSD